LLREVFMLLYPAGVAKPSRDRIAAEVVIFHTPICNGWVRRYVSGAANARIRDRISDVGKQVYGNVGEPYSEDAALYKRIVAV
jgi:hypothetical protein